MSNKNTAASNVEEVWGKLSGRWTGEDANAFHREHIARISEIAGDFDNACSDLSNLSSQCIKELQAIEQSLNQ